MIKIKRINASFSQLYRCQPLFVNYFPLFVFFFSLSYYLWFKHRFNNGDWYYGNECTMKTTRWYDFPCVTIGIKPLTGIQSHYCFKFGHYLHCFISNTNLTLPYYTTWLILKRIFFMMTTTKQCYHGVISMTRYIHYINSITSTIYNLYFLIVKW